MNKFNKTYRIKSVRASFWNYKWAGAYFITICTRDRCCFFGHVKNNKMVLSDIGKIVASEWLKTPKIRPDMKLKLGAHVVMPNHFHGIIIIGRNPYNKVISADDLTPNTHLPTDGCGDEMRDHPTDGCGDALCDQPTDGCGDEMRDQPTDGCGDEMRDQPTDGCRDAMHCVSTSIGNDTSIGNNTSIGNDDSINDDSSIMPVSINEWISPNNRFGPQSKNLAAIIRGFKSAVTIRARRINPGFAWQSRYHDHIIRDHRNLKRISSYIKANPGQWKKDIT